MMALLLGVRAWVKFHPRVFLTMLILVAAAGLLLAVYLKGSNDAKARLQAARAVEEQAALNSDAKADAKAGEQRVQDAQAVAETKEKLINEIAEAADGPPSAADVKLGCQRLRDAKVSVADLPACR